MGSKLILTPNLRLMYLFSHKCQSVCLVLLRALLLEAHLPFLLAGGGVSQTRLLPFFYAHIFYRFLHQLTYRRPCNHPSTSDQNARPQQAKNTEIYFGNTSCFHQTRPHRIPPLFARRSNAINGRPMGRITICLEQCDNSWSFLWHSCHGYRLSDLGILRRGRSYDSFLHGQKTGRLVFLSGYMVLVRFHDGIFILSTDLVPGCQGCIIIEKWSGSSSTHTKSNYCIYCLRRFG